VLVDLYRVVRQSLRASVESYSLKEVALAEVSQSCDIVERAARQYASTTLDA